MYFLLTIFYGGEYKIRRLLEDAGNIKFWYDIGMRMGLTLLFDDSIAKNKTIKDRVKDVCVMR